MLVERLDLGLDMSQGGFEGRAAARVGSSLTEDVFSLQMQLLALPGQVRFIHLLFL